MIRAVFLVGLVLVSSSLTVEAGAHGARPQPAQPGVLPNELDGKMITRAVARVSSKIRGCTTGLTLEGRVDLVVVVSPTGGVTSVTVKKTPHTYVSTCMSDALRKATFPKTVKGGTFTRTYYVTPHPV